MAKPTKPKVTQAQLNELEAKWKRALADYQNLEKRVAAERNQFVKFANITLIAKLLSILDNLERANVHLKDQGLSMVISQFNQILKEEGVEEIKAQGEVFNPEYMECIEKVEGEKNKVISVIQKGYTVHGQVIRPAKVTVGSKPEENNHQDKQGVKAKKESKENNE